MTEYTNTPALRKHALAVEAVMRHFARLNGEDEDVWGVAGLLHNLDCEKFPEELTGLINALCLMRPSKSVLDLEVKSVKKKFKDHSFAAGVNRDTIRSGCEMLGMELEDVIWETIESMKEKAQEIVLKGNL